MIKIKQDTIGNQKIMRLDADGAAFALAGCPDVYIPAVYVSLAYTAQRANEDFVAVPPETLPAYDEITLDLSGVARAAGMPTAMELRMIQDDNIAQQATITDTVATKLMSEAVGGAGDWRAGEHVSVGAIRVFDGAEYEALLAHVTQAFWPPDTTPALWTKIETEGEEDDEIHG